MVEIIVGNSYSQVKGLTSVLFNKLRKILSYKEDPKVTFYRGGFSRPKYLIDKQGFFPTGLLEAVKLSLQLSILMPVFIRDLRKVPESIPNMFKMHLGDKDPYLDQIAATNAAIEHHRGGIQMATGSGKSLVIALIASRLNVRTLVVVPSLEIKKQLKTSLNELFGPNRNIVVENIDSTLLSSDGNYDCLIIDEAHHAAAKTYQVLNKKRWNNIYYRFFLTATFYRNQDHERLLFEGIAGELIYSLSIKDAIARKYIVPIEAYYYHLPRQQTEAYTWSQVYSQLVVNNRPRNRLIGNVLLNLQTEKVSTLCLVKEIAHGEILSELTDIPFANGQDENTRSYIEKFNKGEIKSLIGTTGILGEGIDTKPAEYIIIAGLGKAKSAFLQQIGRGVRNYPGKESCKIVLFRDNSHKFTLRHFNAQKKILLAELGILPLKFSWRTHEED